MGHHETFEMEHLTFKQLLIIMTRNQDVETSLSACGVKKKTN